MVEGSSNVVMNQLPLLAAGKMIIIMVFFVITPLALYSLHAYTKWNFPWKLFLARRRDASKVEEHLDADCAVCLSQISGTEKLSVLLPGCNHGFHVHCIETWLKYHPTCPLCRKTVSPLPPQLQHDFLCLLSLFPSICRWMKNAFNSDDLTFVIFEILSNLEF